MNYEKGKWGVEPQLKYSQPLQTQKEMLLTRVSDLAIL
jgi:hypothetical protein